MLKSNYKPKKLLQKNPILNRVVHRLIDGSLSDGDSGYFKQIYQSLLSDYHFPRPDQYFVLADFDAYCKMEDQIAKIYQDKEAFGKACFVNLYSASKFSSDRTIKQYAKEIWEIEPNQDKEKSYEVER